jgi:hypothetical protein
MQVKAEENQTMLWGHVALEHYDMMFNSLKM